METELWLSHLGTARRKGRKQTCPAYRHRATSRLYPSEPFAFNGKIDRSRPKAVIAAFAILTTIKFSEMCEVLHTSGFHSSLE